MLTLPEPERELWERFVSSGRALLSEHPVLSRWKRALSLGVRATGVPAASGISDVRAYRERAHVLLEESLPLVEPLAQELSTHGLVAVVTDTEGVILASRGGGAFMPRATRARLVEGARWDEPERGTNAIGTALAEEVPVCVIGRAHFEQGNHGLVCYATPLRDVTGKVVGVLDVTGPVEAANSMAKLAVLATGRAIDRALGTRAFGDAIPGGLDVLTRVLERSTQAALLVDPRGKMLYRNTRALALGDAVLRAFRDLSLHGRSEKRSVEIDGRPYRAHIEPIVARGGARLASIVHLEAHTPSIAPRSSSAFDAIVGSDARLVAAKSAAERFARTELAIVLIAETGTGKELFARAIHAASPRKNGPFVAINCGAIPESLVVSELFGHGAGAFTGAREKGYVGRVASASSGTLFLDEVAELPLSAQTALLRFLEDGTYTRVGENDERHADARLVCATCRDLGAMVENGTFRRDLYFRIKGARLGLPPLRDRTDVLDLARALLARLASPADPPALLPDAEAAIAGYAWPGNVRELRTAMGHALALADGGSIDRSHLPEDVHATTAPTATAVAEEDIDAAEGSRKSAEREALRVALDRARGNLSEAARMLGVARSTLYRMLVRHRIS